MTLRTLTAQTSFLDFLNSTECSNGVFPCRVDSVGSISILNRFRSNMNRTSLASFVESVYLCVVCSCRSMAQRSEKLKYTKRTARS
mgnify:CR=1 FL=1